MSWHDPAPREREAGERTWRVVQAAFEERLPVPKRRDWRPFAIAAVAAAVVAAALSPPGQAVFGSIRDAVRGEKNAKPALFSLPTAHSRLLVDSAQGAWVVQSDGSKRLLSGYRDAAWSPHGLFVAAIHGHELRAIEPDGDVHWSIARTGLSSPRWSNAGGGDERVAYLAGSTLRVIGGDGRGDRVLARPVMRIPAAWRPRTHVVAYADGAGRVVVRNADSSAVQWTANARQRPTGLEWSDDGKYLLVRGPTSITIFGYAGGQRLEPLGRGAAPVVDTAFMPSSHALAFVQQARGSSSVWFYPRLRPDARAARRVFAGAGAFDGIAWSPDGRWLALGWRSADQWLFIRSAAVRKVIPVSAIEAAFGPEARFAGWCCP